MLIKRHAIKTIIDTYNLVSTFILWLTKSITAPTLAPAADCNMVAPVEKYVCHTFLTDRSVELSKSSFSLYIQYCKKKELEATNITNCFYTFLSENLDIHIT